MVSLSKQCGQSTVEFALMIVLLMSVVFFVLQMALIFSYGSYVHYATFMSARALLSSRDTPQAQHDAADAVLTAMLGAAPRKRFQFIGTSVNGAAPQNEEIGQDADYQTDANGYPLRNYSWLQGVRYTFRSPLFRIPMAGLGASSSSNASSATNVNSMTLTSESWLGRDPTTQECQTYMNTVEQKTGNKEVLDNGGC